MLFVISFDINLIISCFIRGIQSFIYMVLDNRIICICSNWEPTIRIVKVAIHFSTNYRGISSEWVCFSGEHFVDPVMSRSRELCL